MSVEILVTGEKGDRRRINFGRADKAIVKSEHHSRLPSSLFKTGTWINLCIDVKAIYEYCYLGDQFKYIDAITLGAFC